MALLLDGLSVTNPKGLKAGESVSLPSFFSSEALTVDIMALLLIHQWQLLFLTLGVVLLKEWWWRGEERNRVETAISGEEEEGEIGENQSEYAPCFFLRTCL